MEIIHLLLFNTNARLNLIIPTYMDQKKVDNLDLDYLISDETVCEITDGYVRGKKVGSTTVYASTKNGQEVSFTVTIQDPNTYKFYGNMNSIIKNYQTKGKPKNLTLFIGDSFFDKYFWKTFDTDFTAEQNVFLAGISSTKTSDWEMLKEKLIFDFEPKNVIIHIGTNDIYDTAGNLTPEHYYKGITEFLKDVCEKLPESQIYYFVIENRRYNPKNSITEQVTTLIKTEFSPLYSNFTYIDSPSMINADMGLYISNDGVHLSTKGYEYYVSILNSLVNF